MSQTINEWLPSLMIIIMTLALLFWPEGAGVVTVVLVLVALAVIALESGADQKQVSRQH